ncbi:right-handed parallel beta-helix repeat-containing protein [Mucilaginibacter sp. 44-25]|uniref:right-handed parallel beta-helix repeat-containing protein n=2 Tax=unclassified Mucilaginibacter TaxID=2617802 RepID=UPI0009649837|nr:right-handed parallel beta-helix repeat-containing protein [Mucilaginibacter sp. 44-25]OJW16925.1 MAG: hypothetical protein BGO48_10780 [Mucilaginibacter sp. 44-25]HEK22299.1 hypothetical protein [Bacteroidota bacterium]
MKPLVLLLILFSAQFCNVKNKAMHTQEPTTPTINVKTTGAVGDGRHDDTRAIQNALSSLSKTGGTLFFPAGSYCSSTIVVPSKQNISIKISGVKGRSVIKRIGGDVALFFCETPGSTIYFSGLTLNGNASSAPTSWKRAAKGAIAIDNEVNAIYVYNAERLEVVDCTIRDFHGTGIAAFSTSTLIANNNIISDVEHSGINGHRVNVMQSSNNRISHTGYVQEQYRLNGRVYKSSIEHPVTQFGDGIEAECNKLTANNNVIINAGRCGITHDLGKDLQYNTRSAIIQGNTITYNDNSVINNNPPAGIWCEQSGDVDVEKNIVNIKNSASAIISGIRFYDVDGEIICNNNQINATITSRQLTAGISLLEPSSTFGQINGNVINGNFKSGVVLSYEKAGSAISKLSLMQNQISSTKNSTAFDFAVKNTNNLPGQINLQNNRMTGALIKPLNILVYGGQPKQAKASTLKSTNNMLNGKLVNSIMPQKLGILSEIHE